MFGNFLQSFSRPSVFSAIGQVRNATKKAGGSSKNGRDSIGKRLGVKKFGSESVIVGNIIIRQRGLSVHAGENVGVGRDYTLFALADGFVHFRFNNKKKRNFVSVLPTKEVIKSRKSLSTNTQVKAQAAAPVVSLQDL